MSTMGSSFRLFRIFMVLALIGGSLAPLSWSSKYFPHISLVRADDDEHEGGDEDDAPAQTASTSNKTTKTKKSKPIIKNVVEYRPVTKTIVVTEPGYTTDTDGDGLVDALDPDPQVDQRAYFTDDDNDGVPNAWDQHSGQDDFTFLDEETDSNNNGLIDSYE